MAKISISEQTSTSALLGVIAAAAALLAARGTANVAKAVHTVRTWLNSTHDFFPEDGDPVTCTGCQLIGYGVLTIAAGFLLSLQW